MTDIQKVKEYNKRIQYICLCSTQVENTESTDTHDA